MAHGVSSLKTLFNKIHYCQNPVAGLLLWPLSLFYGAVVGIRNFLYDKIFLKSEKLPSFVVSIGNLTTGGTGKTPITAAAAEYFVSKGKKVAVISRGYGGKLSIKNTNIVSDGEKIFYNAEEAGDEPYWIAKNSPGTIVITGKNRVASGKLAIEKFGAEVLILDDGFQHRKIQRNLDIVLIDAAKKFGNTMLLPAGPLREHLKNIKRADKIVIVNKQPLVEIQELRDKFKTAMVCELSTEKPENITNAAAFTGIAQPDTFFNSLKKDGITLASTKIFPDHHLYTKKDVEILMAEAISAGAQALLTTEKDMVKIEPFVDELDTQIPVCAVKLKVNLDIEKLLSV